MIAVSLVLAVIAYAILPDKVVMQIGTDGQPSNMLPKLPAVIIPFVITSFGAVSYAAGDNEAKIRNIIIVVAGYLVAIFSLIFNLCI